MIFPSVSLNQHVRAAHIGPVGSGVRRGQVTQLPLLNVVLIGTVISGTVSPV